MLKKIWIGVLAALVVLCAVILVRAALFTPGARVSAEPLTDWVDGPMVAASADSSAYRAIAAAARRAFGDIVVVPGITVGGTDSKHYGTVSDNAYRFNPMMIGAQDLTGFHGTNERIKLENLVRATRFYIELIRTAG